MIGSMVALALFGGLFAPHSGGQVQHFKVQAWDAEVRTDAFTGAVTCRLRGRDVTVSHGAAAFRFGRWVNTSEAVYRIDGGPAKSGRLAMNGVATLGVRTIGSNPNNVTGGLVHIPVAELADASRVAIRTGRDASPRTFDLKGLAAALNTEKQRGCDQTRAF